MEEVEAKEFQRKYQLIRHIYESLIGGWDLYKERQTGEKYLIKEIKFYSESDRDEYLPRIVNCPLYQTKKDNGFLRCLGYSCKRAAGEDG